MRSRLLHCRAGSASAARSSVLPGWEAHDAPEELVDTALDIILPLEQTIVAPAMGALGSAGVLDPAAWGWRAFKALVGDQPGWPHVNKLRCRALREEWVTKNWITYPTAVTNQH
eukprot:Skav206028  [mRNA]  locus=scaffold1314:311542:316963:+ [translate_table: standard]